MYWFFLLADFRLISQSNLNVALSITGWLLLPSVLYHDMFYRRCYAHYLFRVCWWSMLFGEEELNGAGCQGFAVSSYQIADPSRHGGCLPLTEISKSCKLWMFLYIFIFVNSVVVTRQLYLNIVRVVLLMHGESNS